MLGTALVLLSASVYITTLAILSSLVGTCLAFIVVSLFRGVDQTIKLP